MNPEISDDIIPNILKRIPWKSLTKFKIVCKTWQSIINDQYFHSLHRCQSKSNHRWLGFEIQPTESVSAISVWHSDDSFASHQLHSCILPTSKEFPNLANCKIVNSCDGVVCLWTIQSIMNEINARKKRIWLWNPSIGQYRGLDFPCRITQRYGPFNLLIGFGFAERARDYKIVVIYKDRGEDRVFVYLLNTSLWRQLKHKPKTCLHRCAILMSKDVTNFRGACHWVCMIAGRATLLCFDLDDEKYRYINLPPIVESKVNSLHMMVYKGMLSVWDSEVFKTESSYKLTYTGWVMKEYGDSSSWTIVLKLELGELLGRNIFGEDASGRLFCNVVKSNGKYMLTVYDPHLKVFRELLPEVYAVVPYEDSLVLL